MKVNFELHIDDVEYHLNATLFDFGATSFHYEEGGYIEVIEGPEFTDIVLTDEDGNQWNPHGEQLETVEEVLYDWWYTAKEENTL